MESVKSSSSLESNYPRLQYIFPVLLCLLLTTCYAVLNYYLYHHGFSSKILLYLGEKSLLAHDGNPPRLENMGFANPPFPHFFTLLLKSPFIATAFVGGFIATSSLMVLLRLYRENTISLTLYLLLFFYITISPLSLFLLCQQMATAILIGLLLLIYHHLYKFCRDNISYNLFMFGILSSLVFLTEFQAILLLFIFIFCLVIKVVEHRPLRALSILFTCLFPVIFVVASWCYLNWLFLGDPFHFVSHWSSALEPLLPFPEKIVHSQTSLGALKASLNLCYENSLLLLPYYLYIFWIIISPRFAQSIGCVTVTIFLAPFCLLYVQLFTNFVEVSQFFFLVFVASAVSIRVHMREQLGKTIFSQLFTVSVAISLVASCWLPFNHSSSEEHVFSRYLIGDKTSGNLNHYIDLLSHVDPKEKILLDDTVNYPLVFLVNDPKRFVLPYEYEFDMVLSAPAQFVKYLVVSDFTSSDAIQGRYPMATNGYVPNFSLIGRFENVFLYKVSQPRELVD
jgi:hypothetical protein